MASNRLGLAGRITRKGGFTTVEVIASDSSTRYAVRAILDTTSMYEPRRITSLVMLRLMDELKESLDGSA